MFEMYIESGGKKLRCGYTTGSCATGAAKAATYMLFSKNDITSIEIDTPKNIKLNLEINNIKRESNSVSCSIIKDGGDDIDATSGMSIFAKAEETDEGFELLGGEGIGVVTKDGLFVEKGEAAINPIPREMIKKEVLNVLPKGKGVKITISAPEGKEVAKKTFNPRLGIEGGISILGTTGIVYPMSEDAIKESIRLEIRQKSKNNKELLFVFGNMGERFIREYGYEKDNIVVISNYVGFSIECAIAQGIKDITIVGHIGKLSKIAFGCFNTHSRVSDVRLEVIALELTLMGYDLSLIEKVLRENTSEGAVKLLGDDFTELYERIGKKILKRLDIYSYGEVHFDILMYYGAKEMKLLYKSSN